MNINYLIIPLLTANIFFTAYVAQKVLYINDKDTTINEEHYGECEEKISFTSDKYQETESKSKNLGWYSDDCDIQKMNLIRAIDHIKRGLITQPEAIQIRDHYRKVCKQK